MQNYRDSNTKYFGQQIIEALSIKSEISVKKYPNIAKQGTTCIDKFVHSISIPEK